jgi:hypothetical protein
VDPRAGAWELSLDEYLRATAIPPPGPHQDWSRNDCIRREGAQNLLAAAVAGGARRYVQQSITFLAGLR